MHGDDKDTWQDELRKRVSGEIRFDEPADRHTSIGVGGRIDALIFPRDLSETAKTIAFLRARRIPFLPVGNWTNLIVRNGGYRGVLISLTGLNGLEIISSGDGDVHLEARRPRRPCRVVTLSLHEGLTGMEFCAGIPGSVGGAVRMNAGAYGSEIKDVVTAVRFAGYARKDTRRHT